MLYQVFAMVSPAVLQGLCFRVLPFAGYALASSRVGTRGKWLALLLMALLICGALRFHAQPREMLGNTLLAWTYLTAAAALAHAATRWWRRVPHTSAGMLLAASTLFLLLPGLLLRNSATLYLLANGLELVFATYSYWVELAAPKAQPGSLGECLTFLLVNPTLVFPARGREVSSPQLSLRAGSRVVLGICGMLFTPALMVVMNNVTPWAGHWAEARGFWYASMFAGIVVTGRLYIEYFAHSSLAHFQIGAMRLLGYELPERYRFPFLARSPEDFWRRWNIYLGTWLQRYAYLPLAARYQRRVRPALWLLAKGFALFLAFSICGLMHEAAGYALRFQFPLGAQLAFSCFGLALGSWLIIRQLAQRAVSLVSFRPQRTLTGFGSVMSWTVCMSLLIGFGTLVLPALGGDGLHPAIAKWLLQ